MYIHFTHVVYTCVVSSHMGGVVGISLKCSLPGDSKNGIIGQHISKENIGFETNVQQLVLITWHAANHVRGERSRDHTKMYT